MESLYHVSRLVKKSIYVQVTNASESFLGILRCFVMPDVETVVEVGAVGVVPAELLVFVGVVFALVLSVLVMQTRHVCSKGNTHSGPGVRSRYGRGCCTSSASSTKSK
jgi:hypothetical protein